MDPFIIGKQANAGTAKAARQPQHGPRAPPLTLKLPSAKLQPSRTHVLAALFGAATALVFLLLLQHAFLPCDVSPSRRPNTPGRNVLPGLGSAALPANQSSCAAGPAADRWRVPLGGRRPDDACWSRSERHLYYCAAPLPPSPALETRLRDYAALHRACTAGVSDWAALLSGAPPPPGARDCQYLLWAEPTGGLGNRLTSLVGAFLYALLTDRALLVSAAAQSNLPRLLCDPFAPASSWWLPESFHDAFASSFAAAPHPKDLLRGVEAQGRGAVYLGYGEDPQFFCDHSQGLLAGVKWVYFSSDGYPGAAMYLVPSFRAEFEQLFPDRLAFPRLARHVLHPNNMLWERATRAYRLAARGAAHVVGVQVRTFDGGGGGAGAGAARGVMDRVLTCAVNIARVLPEAVDGGLLLSDPEAPAARAAAAATALPPGEPPLVSVFLTSLKRKHYSEMKAYFAEGLAVDGSAVAVHSESSLGSEDFGVWGLPQAAAALVEVWVLSFSDALLTSDYSTFGYLAAGLAGVRPFTMNVASRKGFGSWWEGAAAARPACQLAPSPEPCMHQPAPSIECGSYRVANTSAAHAAVRRCVDAPKGIQLLPADRAFRR